MASVTLENFKESLSFNFWTRDELNELVTIISSSHGLIKVSIAIELSEPFLRSLYKFAPNIKLMTY